MSNAEFIEYLEAIKEYLSDWTDVTMLDVMAETVELVKKAIDAGFRVEELDEDENDKEDGGDNE